MKRGTKLERSQLKHGMIVDFTIYATSKRPARTVRGVVSLKEAPSICFDKQIPTLQGCGISDFGLPESWYLDYMRPPNSDCGDFVFQGWHKNVTPKSDNINCVWVVEKKRDTWVPAFGSFTRAGARDTVSLIKDTYTVRTRIRKYVPAKG